MADQNSAKIVPRWEWRTFGTSLQSIEASLGQIASVAPRESSELYLLYLCGPQNAKIREGIFDVKRLLDIDSRGLELWEPVFKAKFPLTSRDVARIFAEWQLTASNIERESYTIDQFLNELIIPRPVLRVAHVTKSRRDLTYSNCIAEFVRLSVDSMRLESFSLEHEQPMRIVEAQHKLGLEGYPNVNYPLALKRALGLDFAR